MAAPGFRTIKETLNIGFDSDQADLIKQGDFLALASGRKVVMVASIADPNYVGTALTVRPETKEVTVRTPFRANRQTRIAGEALVIGGFVVGPDDKVYQYTPASPASFVGTTTGPKTVTVSTDDVIKLTLENGADQTITITAGTNLTFAAIAAEINETLVGMTAFVDASGHICVRAKEVGKAITIGTVTHDAYTLLGWTAGVVAPTNASHDPTAKAGLIVAPAAKDAAVETMEY